MKHKRLFRIVVLAILAFCISGCESKYQDIEKKQMNGMYRETIPDLRKMIEKSPDSAKAHLLLADAYLNTGKLSFSEERFSSALKIYKKENRETEAKRSIGEKYKNAFLGFLESGKDNEQYAFELMLKFADTDTLALAEKDLKTFCNNYMKERGYPLAHNGYKYLAKLNSCIKEEIGQKYLMLFNKVNDQKLKTRIIDDAVEISQEQNITKAHGEHYCKLSEQAETTEGAIAKLNVANRFGNLYASKLQAKQEQLKQERFLILVQKMKAERNDVIHITTTTQKKSKSDLSFAGSRRLSYLSLTDFNVSDGVGYTEDWKKSPNKIKRKDLYCGKDTNLFFTSKKESDVYLFLDKI